MTDLYEALPVPIQVALAVVAMLAAGFGILLGMRLLSDFISPRARPLSTASGDAYRLRVRMRRLAQPTFLLVPSAAAGRSKLGGDPDLPESIMWPDVRGKPCAFLAQLDLAAFQSHATLGWLPDAGLIYAFVDLEGYGFADQVQVRLGVEPPVGPRSPPDGAPRYPERRVEFELHTSLPSLDWLGVDPAKAGLSENDLDELASLPEEPFGDGIQHRIGGYPSEIQGDQMGLICELCRRGLPMPVDGAEIPQAILRASKSWRLLLQVDSDPGLKMDWSDGGRLYVFVREQDARDCDFSRTVTISQTY